MCMAIFDLKQLNNIYHSFIYILVLALGMQCGQ